MTVPIERIKTRILSIRGHRVMLDADLAVLYGVTTGALNQAVKRNAERFPSDFMFRLTVEEGAYLKSQIVISNRSTSSSCERLYGCARRCRRIGF
jgi:ORF6N domain